MAKAPRPGCWADAMTAGAILLLGVLLCATGAGLMEQWQQSSARRQGLHSQDLLGAAASIGGAALVGWWLLSLAFAATTAMLDRRGRSRAAAVTRKLSPAFMQRLVLAVLSLQLASGPGANAAVLISGPEWTPTQDQLSSAPAASAGSTDGVVVLPPVEEAAHGGPAVSAEQARSQQARSQQAGSQQARSSHPAAIPEGSASSGQEDDEAPQDADPREAALVPRPSMDNTATDAAPPSRIAPGWQPVAPVTGPGLLSAPAVRAVEGPGKEADAVTVLAGDTLWDIAAHSMGPEASEVEIALQWPRWYQANKAIIGQNPDALLPGQILQPPPAA
jgi:hypothetical protein